MHPKYKNHEVICDNIKKAKSWLTFFLDEHQDFQSNQNESADEPIEKINPSTADVQNPTGISIKPLSALLDPSKPEGSEPPLGLEDATPSPSPPPIYEDTSEDRLLNNRKFVCHRVIHNGQTGIALVFDRRQHNDMRKLYHKLNQILASNGLRRVTDSIQILNRAKDEISRLEKLDEEFTLQKKEMMVRRSALFKEFSSKLNFLPNTADKKNAVIELKEGLKKIKDYKIIIGNKDNNKWDDTLMIRPDANSKLHPSESEILNSRAVSCLLSL